MAYYLSGIHKARGSKPFAELPLVLLSQMRKTPGRKIFHYIPYGLGIFYNIIFEYGGGAPGAWFANNRWMLSPVAKKFVRKLVARAFWLAAPRVFWSAGRLSGGEDATSTAGQEIGAVILSQFRISFKKRTMLDC